MKIKLSALRAAIDFIYTAEELVAKLGNVGIEIESLEKTEVTFKDVLIARVVRTAPHPTHHKLQLVELDLGPQGTACVCTAATNVREADVIPVVVPGGRTANGMEIGTRTFGTVESFGMLCSWKELGLDGDLLTSNEKEGILHLESDAVVGSRFEEAWPVADTALEVDITPDRGDALSVLGLARWLEVLKARDADRPYDPDEIRLPLPSKLPHSKDDGDLTVTVENLSLCSSYVGVFVQDITSGKSSHSFRTQLYQLCIRPVSRIVDMTNLCLRQYGQPTHAFDYDRLRGHRIVVRTSLPGEAIVTLDGVLRTLEPGTLVIADAEVPVAVAGVMGGLEACVTDSTQRVVFEIAHFDPRAVARSSRHLGIKTDAAYLYERGTDPGRTVSAVSSVLSTLVREQCIGSYVSRVACAGVPAPARPSLDLDLDRVNSYLGSRLDAATAGKLLGYEGITSSGTERTLSVVPPSFRGDLTSWPEYVEEIVRMQGFDEFPCHAPNLALRRGSQSELKTLSKRIRQLLAGMGLMESRTVSFVRSTTVTALGLPPAPALLNPLTVDWDALRPTMLIGLAGAAVRNLSRGRDGFVTFEIGKTFSVHGEAFDEGTSLGILAAGKWQDANWTSPAIDATVFVLKGALESMLRELHVPFVVTTVDSPLLEAGASATISSGSTVLGVFGILRHQAGAVLGMEQNVFYAELSLDALLGCIPTISFKEFSRFPSIRRDIAVLVDSSVTAGQLQAAIAENGGPLLKEIVVFDSFQGGCLPTGKKSVGFSMEFVSPDRTLLGEEIGVLVSSIEAALATRAGGILRRTRE
jgi:phenylalanyl-tRNA synthetase beta chain